MPPASLQDITAPEGVCYGCGASNRHGLHIKSRWTPTVSTSWPNMCLTPSIAAGQIWSTAG